MKYMCKMRIIITWHCTCVYIFFITLWGHIYVYYTMLPIEINVAYTVPDILFHTFGSFPLKNDHSDNDNQKYTSKEHHYHCKADSHDNHRVCHWLVDGVVLWMCSGSWCASTWKIGWSVLSCAWSWGWNLCSAWYRSGRCLFWVVYRSKQKVISTLASGFYVSMRSSLHSSTYCIS